MKTLLFSLALAAMTFPFAACETSSDTTVSKNPLTGAQTVHETTVQKNDLTGSTTVEESHTTAH